MFDHFYCLYNVHIQDQYIFIHDAILESVTCGDTQIASNDLRNAIKKLEDKGFAHQFTVSLECARKVHE